MKRRSARLGIRAAALWLCCAVASGQEAKSDGETTDVRRERIAPIQDLSRELVLPTSGERRPGRGRRVLTPDETGRPVVGKLHCEVGELGLVILPTGQMKSVRTSQLTPTERPFAPVAPADLLARLRAGRFAKFKSEVSERYAYLYDCDDSFYQTTRDILESLYDGVEQALGSWQIPHAKPELPLAVLILPDRAAFQAYRAMPEGVLAYYDGVSNFVVLYQDPELSDAAPELALKQAAYTIAHEGVHQLLHNFGVQQRLAPWPAWISEGLPELFCPMKITSNMIKQGASTMPQRRVRWNKLGLVNDLRMYDLLKAPTTGGEALEQLVGGEKLTARGYAVAWGLAHFLASKNRQPFREFLRDASAIQPLEGFPDRRVAANQELFTKHFGGEFARIESSVAEYLNGKPMQSQYHDPIEYQTHYVVVHSARRGRSTHITVMIGTSPAGARKWKEAEERRSDETKNDLQHSFRSEACETRRQAEAIVARIGKKR